MKQVDCLTTQGVSSYDHLKKPSSNDQFDNQFSLLYGQHCRNQNRGKFNNRERPEMESENN